MIKHEALFAFVESNYDYLLVVDTDEKVVHVSENFRRDCLPAGFRIRHMPLEKVITPFSLGTFRFAMRETLEGVRGIGIFTPSKGDIGSLPMKTSYIRSSSGDFFLFYRSKLAGLDKVDGWEKDERIKELSCLYEVADLIETSVSVQEFFSKFPGVVSQGMLFPDDVVVYSFYQGVEYGKKPESNYLSVKLVYGQQEEGEIRVGYPDSDHALLPEEQKMLDEIGRTLSLALDRKQLRDRLVMKQEESAEYTRKLESLKKEIESRTRELEKQKSKLNVVNSYLARVNRGWEESKYMLETMFKAIPDEVILLDRDRKVVMSNRDDIEPGDYCYKSYFHRDKPCENCRLARILAEKTPVMLTMKHDDRFLQVHALPVYNKDHEVDGILEFYRDVTLEKTMDQQLQQADKLASLGQLVSGIGHEINNPNQFIRGNIKILKQALEDILPIVDDHYRSHPELKIARLDYTFFREHVMVLVDDMSHGSERIKGIVEGLRNFVRKDEGLLVDKVDINTLIEAATRLVHNQVHKRADMELELSREIPLFTGNSQKIEQVLINLIVNAGDAMPEDKKGVIKVRTRMDGGSVVVEVEDNGKGMNQSVLKQIFDPFFTTKRAQGGTGLGLAIAYKIVGEHGGNISVRSRPGAGTTFTIRIPAGKPAAPGREVKDEKDPDN